MMAEQNNASLVVRETLYAQIFSIKTDADATREYVGEGFVRFQIASDSPVAEKIMVDMREGTMVFGLSPQTMVMRSQPGLYVYMEQPGATIFGFDLRQSPPHSLALFDTVLRQNCEMEVDEESTASSGLTTTEPAKQETTTTPTSTANDDGFSVAPLAVGVERGGYILASSILKGTRAFGSALQSGSQWLSTTMSPSPMPVEVSPGTVAGIDKVKEVTSAVLRASDIVVSGVLTGVRKVGTAVTDAFPILPEASSTPSSARQVAASSVMVLADVWTTMRRAVRSLATDASVAAVRFANHKWGPDVASVVDKSLGAVADVGKTVWNVKTVATLGLLGAGIECADFIVSKEEWLQGNVLFGGWLQKRNITYTTWDFFFALLRPNALCLYDHSECEQLQWIIGLEDVMLLRVTADDELEIVTIGDTIYWIRVQDGSLQMWIEQLQMAMDNCEPRKKRVCHMAEPASEPAANSSLGSSL
eukprot:GILK01005791.1.p1 GENE.GILK01005791.1~~GILK01005791.1.p1  ORF type:complete len:475 (-),score=74.34 GILK01005791.1:106-1530(-)